MKVIAMMMRVGLKACECDTSVFYNVPMPMPPLNMGGTLRQRQYKVFVQFLHIYVVLVYWLNPLWCPENCDAL